MNIVTVIQARRGSTRLPNKIFMEVLGESILWRQIERVQRSKLKGRIIVATTREAEDDEIEAFCNERKIPVFRGSTNNLVERHLYAAKQYGADAVVKIPSDCPLIDPAIIDKVVSTFIQKQPVDYVSNLHPATWPDGNDVEIMHMATLEKVMQEADKTFELEHTTPYIWENPGKFKIDNVSWETGNDFSTSYRWTLDYAEDFELIKAIYQELYPQNPAFTLEDILNLLQVQPELMEINKMYTGEYWYKDHLSDLKHIDDKWKKD